MIASGKGSFTGELIFKVNKEGNLVTNFISDEYGTDQIVLSGEGKVSVNKIEAKERVRAPRKPTMEDRIKEANAKKAKAAKAAKVEVAKTVANHPVDAEIPEVVAVEVKETASAPPVEIKPVAKKTPEKNVKKATGSKGKPRRPKGNR